MAGRRPSFLWPAFAYEVIKVDNQCICKNREEERATRNRTHLWYRAQFHSKLCDLTSLLSHMHVKEEQEIRRAQKGNLRGPRSKHGSIPDRIALQCTLSKERRSRERRYVRLLNTKKKPQVIRPLSIKTSCGSVKSVELQSKQIKCGDMQWAVNAQSGRDHRC